MKIRWVRLAWVDLEEAVNFIARDNPAAARKMDRSGSTTSDHAQGQGADRFESAAYAVVCEHFERPATPPSGVRRGYETTSKRIWEAARLLGEHPGAGRAGRVPGTRELVIGGTPFILPYRVKDNTVQILRVLHASRKWPRKF